MTRAQFRRLVDRALRSLPARFRQRLDNIDVVVEDGEEDGDLGLYEGIPLTERTHDYGMVLPDKITLFQRAIEAECRETGADVYQEICDTLRHEIAHHFGISDERMEDSGTY